MKAATDLGKQCLQTAPDDPLGLKGFTYYFEQLYWRKSLDTQQILSLHLMPNSEWAFAFRSATEKFRLIPDDTEALLVSYKNDNLLKQLKPEKADRRLLRKLQRYTVNVYPEEMKRLHLVGAAKEILPGLNILTDPNRYHTVKGLLLPEGDGIPVYEPDYLIKSDL